MTWILVGTVLVTILLVLVALNFATPEKKLEKKIDHLHPLSSAQFRREMGVILGPGIVSGNQVQSLQNGDEIFPAMLEAVHSARKTILFETYIYWSGDIGTAFAEALAERARAGVRVCLGSAGIGQSCRL